jgi:hypothetical protein
MNAIDQTISEIAGDFESVKKHAGKLIGEILKKQWEFEDIIIDGITAEPGFKRFENLETLILDGFSDDEILSMFAFPSHYFVTGQFSAKAPTAKEAVEKAKKKIEKLKAMAAECA